MEGLELTLQTAQGAHEWTESSKRRQTAAGNAKANVRSRCLACRRATQTRTNDSKEKPPPKSMAPNAALALSLKPGPTVGRASVGSLAAW
jgi:hypothetical protein